MSNGKIPQTDYLSMTVESLSAEIESLRAENEKLWDAGKGVVDWWLREGKDKFDGAPGEMFNLRAVIGYE